MDQITISSQALDQLMPMHLVLDPHGEILSAGLALQKLSPGMPLAGRKFADIFNIRRPRQAHSISDLLSTEGARLNLSLRAAPKITLKGLVIGLENGRALINLSLGISIVEAVAAYDLTISDFAVTDLAIEMLYLVEANSAVSRELLDLTYRLQGAKLSAEEQALTDTLTGLKNRRVLDFSAKRLISLNQPFSILHIDLDFFKRVNDSLGHAAGDAVLKRVAEVLKSESRDRDLAIRFGGDEFLLVLVGVVDPGILGDIAQRIITRLEEPIHFAGQPCRISASIGISMSNCYKTPDIDTMLHDADMALYDSKRAGRGRTTFALVGDGEPPRTESAQPAQ